MTMTKLEALIQLRDDVKAGRLPIWPVTSLAVGAFSGYDVISAHKDSLDAAKALHEAVPTPAAIMDNETMALILFGRNGARTWLLWKIEALIAQEQ